MKTRYIYLVLLFLLALTTNDLKAQSFFAGTGAGTNNTGADNTGVGSNALHLNTSAGGSSAFGTATLSNNTTHGPNDAFGDSVLFHNTSGYYNVGVGYQSLISNTTGTGSVGVGTLCLKSSTSGVDNTAVGFESLYSNTTGSYNTGIGYRALNVNSTGSYNTAVGLFSMANATSSNNSALGYESLSGLTTGSGNVAIGYLASTSLTTGSDNSTLGYDALQSEVSGVANTAIGFEAFQNMNNTDSFNTALGFKAGQVYSNYLTSTFIGALADESSSGLNNVIAVGYDASVNASNKTVIGNSSTTVFGYYGVLTSLSDARYKTKITENVPGLAFIKQLRPVTYHFDLNKLDKNTYGSKAAEYEKSMGSAIQAKEKIQYTGFIAQEVDQAAKAINYDFSGVVHPQNANDNYGLDYSEFVVPLVKAAQEQQKMIDDQAATIQKQQDALTAQGAQLQALVTQMQSLQDCCYSSNKDANTSGSIAPQLLNAAPNPTSNSTTIYYYLPQNTKIATIDIKDGNGNAIKSVSIAASGYSSVVIETADLSSGVYYYSLTVDGQITDTKKLSVLK